MPEKREATTARAEEDAWRAYDWNAQLLAQPLDPSDRAKKIRAINRIALRHHWQDGIAHFLDTKGAASISELTATQVDDLHDRMLGYLDAAEAGCDLEWSLPAR